MVVLINTIVKKICEIAKAFYAAGGWSWLVRGVIGWRVGRRSVSGIEGQRHLAASQLTNVTSTVDMALLRPTAFSRRAAQLAASTPRSIAARRTLSSTQQLRGGASHDDHFDPPGGVLFGVKPGEKYQEEGWEKIFYWGFFGSLAFGIVGYAYKPDTRFVSAFSRNHNCPLADGLPRKASRPGPSRRPGEGSKPRVS